MSPSHQSERLMTVCLNNATQQFSYTHLHLSGMMHGESKVPCLIWTQYNDRPSANKNILIILHVIGQHAWAELGHPGCSGGCLSTESHLSRKFKFRFLISLTYMYSEFPGSARVVLLLCCILVYSNWTMIEFFTYLFSIRFWEQLAALNDTWRRKIIRN